MICCFLGCIVVVGVVWLDVCFRGALLSLFAGMVGLGTTCAAMFGCYVCDLRVGCWVWLIVG